MYQGKIKAAFSPVEKAGKNEQILPHLQEKIDTGLVIEYNFSS